MYHGGYCPSAVSAAIAVGWLICVVLSSAGRLLYISAPSCRRPPAGPNNNGLGTGTERGSRRPPDGTGVIYRQHPAAARWDGPPLATGHGD